MQERTYIAIDLKSFYASVECMDRGLDPLTTNLVVADLSRTEKTICLAVSPSLKAYGISGRARLFEVVQKVREVNAMRQQKAPGRRFAGAGGLLQFKSCDLAVCIPFISHGLELIYLERAFVFPDSDLTKKSTCSFIGKMKPDCNNKYKPSCT